MRGERAGETDGQTDGQADGQTDRRTGRQSAGRAERQRTRALGSDRSSFHIRAPTFDGRGGEWQTRAPGKRERAGEARHLHWPESAERGPEIDSSRASKFQLVRNDNFLSHRAGPNPVPVSSSRFPVPGFQFPVSNFQFPVSVRSPEFAFLVLHLRSRSRSLSRLRSRLRSGPSSRSASSSSEFKSARSSSSGRTGNNFGPHPIGLD